MLSLWRKWSTKEEECDQPMLPSLLYRLHTLWSPLLGRIWTRQCWKTTLYLLVYLAEETKLDLSSRLLLLTTLCVRSTLFQLYLKPCPLQKQTNKCECSSSFWWCWFKMNWNFVKLEESAHCLRAKLQVLILFCEYSFSQNLQEDWIVISDWRI